MLHEVFDPNPHNTTHTQEATDLSKGGTVWPLQNLLDLLILGVMTLVSALVANCNHFWHTELHLPPGEGSASFFESLEDPIHIIKVLPNEPSNSRIVHNDLIVQSIWTEGT